MATSITPSTARRRAARIPTPGETTLSARARSAFRRARARFGSLGSSAWATAQQPEHLFAAATWGETPSDRDE